MEFGYIKGPLHDNPMRDDIPYPVPSNSTETTFCVLLEDMPNGHNSWAYATRYTWEGSVIGVVKLYNWGSPAGGTPGIIDGAKAGYWMTAEMQGSKWRFEQGPCISKCSTAATIDFTNPPDAFEDSAYTLSPDTANIVAGSYAKVSGPAWVSVNATNGDITGTPPPGSAGKVVVVIKGDGPKTGSTTGEVCVVTKAVEITISAGE